jgi:hypothetical protein
VGRRSLIYTWKVGLEAGLNRWPHLGVPEIASALPLYLADSTIVPKLQQYEAISLMVE